MNNNITDAKIVSVKYDKKFRETFTEFQNTANKHGILVLDNLMCCQTCGYALIESELDNLLSDGYKAVMFSHEQDSENFVEDSAGGLYFSWSLLKPNVETEMDDSIALGTEIIKIAMNEGLFVNWEFTPAHRIVLL